MFRRSIACQVYTVNHQGLVYTQPIVQWHQRGKQEVFEYCLEDGMKIRATKDHKFMVNTGEMLAIDDIFLQGLDLLQLAPNTPNVKDASPQLILTTQ